MLLGFKITLPGERSWLNQFSEGEAYFQVFPFSAADYDVLTFHHSHKALRRDYIVVQCSW